MIGGKAAGVGHRQGRGGSLVPVIFPVLTPVFSLVFSSVFVLAGGSHASLLSCVLDAPIDDAASGVSSIPVRASLPQL